ncbi:DUF4389 domain-containing protein [Paraglaciecola arctica]|uniref:Lipase n=1 Tax=Paraglaciecola arctica BSs20135 TaxID=493475 RepID=K6YTV3_9ALTE|nr:DUF4389 domain-containing protein [Paraglaciecola arctica]GAC21602.1 lipase [Paraglaciecola arctica BSs20135]
MDQKTKTTLANLDTWKRGLFMVVFTIISGVAKLIVTLVALFQFITLLFKGQTNEEMIPFGQNLSTYLYQITLFLTFKTDDMPFPFRPFPDGTPELNINEGNEGNNATNETTTINDEAPVDVTEEDVKDEIRAVKDTKDDATNG